MNPKISGLVASGLVAMGGIAALLAGPATADDTQAPGLGPDQLVFSAENMDTSVDPAQDFYRYASGKWLDRVERPEGRPSWGVFEIMVKRLKEQMATLGAEAAEGTATAPKGSPTQLVGDFYKAYMDVEAIDAAGVEPVREQLEEIDAIDSFDGLTRFMAEQARAAGPTLFALFVPSSDPADNSRYAMFVIGQSFGVDKHYTDLLRNAEGDPRVAAYRTYVADVLKIAGYPEAEAERVADTVLDVEFAIFAGLLTPEEANNPANRYSTKSFDDVQAMIPELDVSLFFDTIGFEKPKSFYMFEPRLLPALSQLWQSRPLQDLKDYAKFRVIQNYAEFLTSKFDAPTLALSKALSGGATKRPREDAFYRLMIDHLGHPASQIYIDAYYSEETRAEILDMVKRLQDVFRRRIPTRDWISEPTRQEALKKVDSFYYKVGYPDHWIDYSSVDIGSDPVQNLRNLGSFSMDRLADKLTRPVELDEFNTASTLPIAMNAAYNPSINGFEISAVITQPPVFSIDMDPALKFCRAGAIIGHEMTHGFDSGGRQYDSTGNFRDWWAPEDAAAFEAEAEKLVEQSDAFEVLPGAHANGRLNIRENMADVGGITLAHQALMEYLDEHPDENVEIDGLTQEQRCFVAWAQMWTMKAAEPYLRAILAGDGHPPNFYRTVAALQHLDAFYAAFGIEAGDPMWLPPEKRVHAW